MIFRKRLGQRSRKNSQSGFTLLEVLVALAILSSSLAVLLAIFSQSLDRTRQDQTHMAARLLAQSLMAQTEKEPSEKIHNDQGTRDNFHWDVQLSPYGSSDDRSAWTLDPVRIAVTVAWSDHGNPRALTLSTIRLRAKSIRS